MMVGAVIGGLYFWGIDPLAKFNSLMGNTPPSAESAHPQAVAMPPSYVDFGLLIVPVVMDRNDHRQAEMILRIEVPFDKKELVAQNLPRLQNAFLQDMLGFLPPLLRDNRTLDEGRVARRLAQVGTRLMGPGIILGVQIEQSSVH